MPWRGYGELIHLKATCHLARPMLALALVHEETLMTDLPAGPRGEPWFKKTRAAALGFGLGATLALSPLVWAQNPPASGEAAPATPPPAAGVLAQQSFAPLVKRVSPAVVNISVTEKTAANAASEQLPE